MVDIMSKEKRSELMSKIRSQDTRIEKLILKEMKKQKMDGFAYQLKMIGNPDFVFPKQKLAIFCDGDFWHGYRFHLRKSTLGKYWVEKISRNMKRDKKVRSVLKKNGWKVIRFWEHQINDDPANCVDKIQQILKDSTTGN